MGRDHAVGAEAAQFPHFGEIGAVVHGLDDHQPTLLDSRRDELELKEGPPDAPGCCGRFSSDHDGLGSRQDILLSGKGSGEEHGLQGQHVLGAGKLRQHRTASHRPHRADLVRRGGLHGCLHHQLACAVGVLESCRRRSSSSGCGSLPRASPTIVTTAAVRR